MLGACIYDQPSNAVVDPPEHEQATIDAVIEVVQEWTEREPSQPDIEIRWLDGECIEDLRGLEGCKYGTYSIDAQIIYVMHRPHVWQTLLAHELLHYYHHRLIGDPDLNHASEWWQLESLVNRRICRAYNPNWYEDCPQ